MWVTPKFPCLPVVFRRRRTSSSVAVVRRPSVCRRPSVAIRRRPSSVVVGVVRQSSVCRPSWVFGSTAPRKGNQSPAALDNGCLVEGSLYRPLQTGLAFLFDLEGDPRADWHRPRPRDGAIDPVTPTRNTHAATSKLNSLVHKHDSK